MNLKFIPVRANDTDSINLIANWYLSEWKIPVEKTIQNLKTITTGHSQFQILLLLDDTPVATGGLYHHVGLLDKEPRFSIHKNWLALLYTIPEKRHQGLGARLCEHIQYYSGELGIKEIHLFTDTAEKLYEQLGWHLEERVSLGERNVAVMKKEL